MVRCFHPAARLVSSELYIGGLTDWPLVANIVTINLTVIFMQCAHNARLKLCACRGTIHPLHSEIVIWSDQLLTKFFTDIHSILQEIRLDDCVDAVRHLAGSTQWSVFGT